MTDNRCQWSLPFRVVLVLYLLRVRRLVSQRAHFLYATLCSSFSCNTDAPPTQRGCKNATTSMSQSPVPFPLSRSEHILLWEVVSESFRFLVRRVQQQGKDDCQAGLLTGGCLVLRM